MGRHAPARGQRNYGGGMGGHGQGAGIHELAITFYGTGTLMNYSLIHIRMLSRVLNTGEYSTRTGVSSTTGIQVRRMMYRLNDMSAGSLHLKHLFVIFDRLMNNRYEFVLKKE